MTSEIFTEDEIDIINDTKSKLQALIKNLDVYNYYSSNDDEYSKFELVTTDQLVIAGGCIASLINKESINDIDVFILNNQKYIFEQLIKNKKGIWTLKYHIDKDNEYSADYVVATAFNSETKVQYILTKCSSRKELLSKFDFVHTTASYYMDKLYITKEAFDAIRDKFLIRQNSEDKVKKYRLNKLRMRGWILVDNGKNKSPIQESIFTDNFKQSSLTNIINRFNNN